MRRRLIAAFVGLTVLTIAVFAVAGAYSVTAQLEDDERREIDRSVTLMAGLVGERVRDGDQITTSFLQRQLTAGEHLQYDAADGAVVEAHTSGIETASAGENLARTRLVAGGGAVTLTRSAVHVEERVAEAVEQIVLFGVVLVAVAALVGFLAARRMSRPFQDLARVANEFGRGRFDVEVPHYSIPEAEEIGSAMREAQRDVVELIAREREFAGNASHQLKTPITALRLYLEDLTLWPQTHPDVAGELTRGVTELDRLTSTVNDLIELAHGRRMGSVVEIDLCEVIAETAQRWRPRVEASRRTLLALTPGQVAVRLRPGPVPQILDILIENALRHGAGAISVIVAALDTHVRIRVSDQGEGVIEDEVFRRKININMDESRGYGISLSIATEIAKALGGYLRLEPEPPTTFSLLIPRSRPPG